jgi:hypothetical protein
MPLPALKLQTGSAYDPQGIGGSGINHYGDSYYADFRKITTQPKAASSYPAKL